MKKFINIAFLGVILSTTANAIAFENGNKLSTIGVGYKDPQLINLLKQIMQHIIFLITTIGVILLFTGCATGSQPGGFSFKTAANGPMLTKMEKPSKGNTLIYIYREYNNHTGYAQLSEELYANGMFITELRADGFYPLHIRPGKYTFTLGDEDVEDVEDNNKFTLKAEEGKVYVIIAKMDYDDKGPRGYGAEFQLEQPVLNYTDAKRKSKKYFDEFNTPYYKTKAGKKLRNIMIKVDDKYTTLKYTDALITSKLTSSRDQDIEHLVSTIEEYKKMIKQKKDNKYIKYGAVAGTINALNTNAITSNATGSGVDIDTNNLAQNLGSGLAVGFVASGIMSKSSAYQDLHYNGISNYDMNYLFEGKKRFKDLRNPSEEVQLEYVSFNPKNIKYIKNPSKKVQKLAVIEGSKEILKYIKNPSKDALDEYNNKYMSYDINSKRTNSAIVYIYGESIPTNDDIHLSISDKYNTSLEIGKFKNTQKLSFKVNSGETKFSTEWASRIKRDVSLNIEAGNEYWVVYDWSKGFFWKSTFSFEQRPLEDCQQ